MQGLITADEVMKIVSDNISDWHVKNENRAPDAEILTDEIRAIRPLNVHRDNIADVIRDLVIMNLEMWHEHDKLRSDNDDIVFGAVNNVNVLNQHRNDLIEEIDEIFMDSIKK